jgi:hypothetical protein
MNAHEPENDEPILVHATWNKRFPGFQILAFADRSYLIDIGSDRKPPLIVIGWYRWHPNSIELKRWGWGPWPRDNRDG